MFAKSTVHSLSEMLAASRAAVLFVALFFAWGFGLAVSPAEGQNPASLPAAVVPLEKQPPAKIFVDPPLPDQLAKGIVVIQFRTENLRISPVFGALAVSPRIGHLHVFVDDNPWLWAHMSNEELLINGLPPGSHKVRIDLVNSNHETLAQEVVSFEVPRRSPGIARENLGPEEAPVRDQPKLIVEPPQPDLLAHGVAYFRFKTENVQIAPVFGPAALRVSPRIAHLEVSVDDASWHWTDASGQPVDVGGLPSGPHQVRIALVDTIGQVLAQHVAKVDVP